MQVIISDKGMKIKGNMKDFKVYMKQLNDLAKNNKAIASAEAIALMK